MHLCADTISSETALGPPSTISDTIRPIHFFSLRDCAMKCCPFSSTKMIGQENSGHCCMDHTMGLPEKWGNVSSLKPMKDCRFLRHRPRGQQRKPILEYRLIRIRPGIGKRGEQKKNGVHLLSSRWAPLSSSLLSVHLQ